MEGGEQDKSEAATPFKLQRAREKGVVARGTDLGFFAGLLAVVGILWFEGARFAGVIGTTARAAFISAGTGITGDRAVLAVTAEVLAALFYPLAIFCAVMFVVVTLGEIVQTGINFSAAPLKPDFSRLNPGQGLKRLFSKQLLIESAKSILKLVVYTLIVALLASGLVASLAPTLVDATELGEALSTKAFQLLAYGAMAAFGFAILDQMLVRRTFLTRMRMSRRELKREVRDREGDSRIKQRRRKLHAEFAANARSLVNVRDADLIVVNPVHVAVALRYDAANMDAPKVVARGAGALAQRIKSLGGIYGKMIVHDPALARALFRRVAIDREIGEDLYNPVADHYLRLRRERTRG